MPVSNNYHAVEYEGNNSGRSFSFPFRCFSLDHLVVELITVDDSAGVETEVVKTLGRNTEYAVAGGLGNDGGSVTYPLLPELPALAPAEKIRIYRSTPLSQDIDYPTYQQAIENALDKAVMINQEVAAGSQGAQQAITDFALRVRAAESVADAAAGTAGTAKSTADEALLTSRLADGNASIAVSTAEAAETKAAEAVNTASTAAEDADYAVGKVAEKLERDGSNIDRLAFLQNAGFRDEDLNLDLTDLAQTGGSNIDPAAYRSMLGIDEIDNDVTALAATAANTSGSNIDVEGYSVTLGLGDLAGTSGSNIDVVAFKTALAPRVVTSLDGVTGNYTGEQILRASGIADDPDDDLYFWDGSQFRKEGV